MHTFLLVVTFIYAGTNWTFPHLTKILGTPQAEIVSLPKSLSWFEIPGQQGRKQEHYHAIHFIAKKEKIMG